MPNGTRQPFAPTTPFARPLAPTAPLARPAMASAGLPGGLPKPGATTPRRRKNTVTRIAAALILLTILGWGGVFLAQRLQNGTLITTTTQISEINATLTRTRTERVQAEALAAQLSNQSTLLGRHVHWSALLKALSAVTPRTISFTEFAADVNGTISVSGYAQSLTALAKFSGSLSKAPNFSEITVSNTELTAAKRPRGGSIAVFAFRATFTFTPSVLKK